MRIIKYLLYLIILLIGLFLIFLVTATISDYDPDKRLVLFEDSSPDTILTESRLDILSWNVGYCGLGAEMDFFFDGGKNVRASRENTLKNTGAIGRFLANNDSVEFILLQEVDINSKRTYHNDQFSKFSKLLKYPYSYFAPNYKSFFVPVPPAEPMGKVNSGLMSLSKIKPFMVERYDYPGNYSWPKRLFMLDRCFMVNRFALSNSKSLLIINTHNSAFDGGILKEQEMACLRDFVLEEYEKGNYILVGGDWNQNPPGFEDKQFNKNSGYENFVLKTINEDFLPSGWKWIYDPATTTNRSNSAPYNKESTTSTILDFFLVSPNIQSVSSRSIDLDFQNSDHQPVLSSIKLQ